MERGALRVLMQMPDIHVAGVAFGGQSGFGNRGVFGLVQVVTLDIATQEETSGGEVMDDGVVAHDLVRLIINRTCAGGRMGVFTNLSRLKFGQPKGGTFTNHGQNMT